MKNYLFCWTSQPHHQLHFVFTKRPKSFTLFKGLKFKITKVWLQHFYQSLTKKYIYIYFFLARNPIKKITKSDYNIFYQSLTQKYIYIYFWDTIILDEITGRLLFVKFFIPIHLRFTGLRCQNFWINNGSTKLNEK